MESRLSDLSLVAIFSGTLAESIGFALPTS
jgi:hypothetical protein